MENLQLKDLITNVFIDKIKVTCYKLEVVKIMKEKSNKRKDATDISILNDFGYDVETYNHLKKKLGTMEFKIVPKSKILKLLFRQT